MLILNPKIDSKKKDLVIEHPLKLIISAANSFTYLENLLKIPSVFDELKNSE
jgi:hypothetical protein